MLTNIEIPTARRRMPDDPPDELLNLFDHDAIARLRDTLAGSPVIVELRFPASPSTPERIVFNQYDMLADYLRRVARSGDAITIWRYNAVCRDDNALLRSEAAGVRGSGAE